MISTRDLVVRFACVLALVLGSSGCGEPASELSPLDQAKVALAKGDGLGAELILREMLSSSATKSDLAAYLGEAELEQGELAEARRWLGPGEFSEESRAHGFHMLARLEMASNNLPAAGEAFDKALAINRENAGLWVDIGRLRYRGGEQAQAVEASIYAIELDPENTAALQFRAQLVRDAEGLEEALVWFERALERNPDDVGLLSDYAATLGELGRVREMLTILRQIRKIDPANRHIYYLQAVLAARAGKYDLAQSLLLRSGREDREKPAGLLLSGIIDLENGNYASAAQTLGRLSAMQPDNRRVTSLLAKSLSLGGNDSELVYRFGERAAQPSSSPYLKSLVGRSYEALDKRELAADFIDSAAAGRSGNLVAVGSDTTLDVAEARGPNSGLDALALVRARILSRNFGGAVEAAEQFYDRFPGSTDALTLSADAYLVARNYPAAIERYQQAAAIRRPWVATRKLLKALEADHRDRDATALLENYLAGDPANLEATTMLALHRGRAGQWDKAALLADHALLNGGYNDPVLLALRSEIALRQGDVELAIHLAEGAYALQPMNAETTRTLAMAYRALKGGDELASVLEQKLRKLQR